MNHMGHLEEFVESMSSKAHSITGDFMQQGKIKSYEVTRNGRDMSAEIRFTDNGLKIVVELQIVSDE